MIADNLSEVQKRIAKAALVAGRRPEDITLIAVSKTHPAEAVRMAIAAGQKIFGENRVQEAEAKFSDIRNAFPDIALHLIGPLQTNKVKEAVALFDVIHTLDRPKLAAALAKEMARQNRTPRLFVEVNIGAEDQKAGILPEHTADFIRLCCEEHGLRIEGLMCIPPHQDDPRPYFEKLRQLAEDNSLSKLSMGMSSDFESAIECGATHVRVGTAIFGTREKV